MIDADQIYQGLWQGSRPPVGSKIKVAGFQLLVLCAEEYQPPAYEFHGVDVYHAPNQDNALLAPSRDQLAIALAAATKVADILQTQRPVLVTCWMGLNRSGLVTALALHKSLGISGAEACALVKRVRPWALSNPQFVECLARIPRRA